MSSRYLRPIVAAIAVPVLCLGCSRSPRRIEMQSVDPDSAALQAIRMFDTNGDETIDKEEVKASAGLAAAFAQFDSDGNGQLEEAEIQQRLQMWVDDRVALFGSLFSVTLDRKPLAGATVTLEPEPFLGEYFQTMKGTTAADGYVQFPIPEGMPAPGLLTGLYRVKVSKIEGGKEVIPARYNENTILGQEVSSHAAGLDRVVLRLSSK